MESFEEFEEFEEWFQHQPRENRNLIAVRAVMREISLLDAAVTELAFDELVKVEFVLCALRCNLVSVVAVYMPSYNMNKPARKAAAFADRTVGSAYEAGDTGDEWANPNHDAIYPNAQIVEHAAQTALTVSSEDGVANVFRTHSATLGALFDDTDIGYGATVAPLWPASHTSEWVSARGSKSLRLTSLDDNWSFWREWYQGFLDGKPLDWELQRRVALIPEEDWEKGSEHVAEKIEEIRRKFETEKRLQHHQHAEKPVSAEAAKAMAQRLRANRDAITLASASALEQIAEFREVVRGNNQLGLEYREQLLGFLDELATKLRRLHCLMPKGDGTPDAEQGMQGVRWLNEFKSSFFKEAIEYASAENVAKSIIPTGIILTCTVVGSLMGMPVAGTVIGGLITGQIKPGKAADDLLKPKAPDAE